MLQAVQREYSLDVLSTWQHGVKLAAQLVHELLAAADVALHLKLHCCCCQYQQWRACYQIGDTLLDAAQVDMVT